MEPRRKLGRSLGAPEVIEAQAAELRRLASAWCESATPSTVLVGKILCSINVLSYTDLIEDACALEADAAKIRNAYRTRTI